MKSLLLVVATLLVVLALVLIGPRFFVGKVSVTPDPGGVELTDPEGRAFGVDLDVFAMRDSLAGLRDAHLTLPVRLMVENAAPIAFTVTNVTYQVTLRGEEEIGSETGQFEQDAHLPPGETTGIEVPISLAIGDLLGEAPALLRRGEASLEVSGELQVALWVGSASVPFAGTHTIDLPSVPSLPDVDIPSLDDLPNLDDFIHFDIDDVNLDDLQIRGIHF